MARAAGAAAIVDPRPSDTPEIRQIYEAYPHTGPVLPVGYSPEQLSALEATINATAADAAVTATPIDLARLLKLKMPVVRARYEFHDAGTPTPGSLVGGFLAAPPG
ncbi:MAG TPA: hypothetical protein VN808_05455 [Stellaceae bacterium]|nr:hypothetical protein [Stellaceae bacterium]